MAAPPLLACLFLAVVALTTLGGHLFAGDLNIAADGEAAATLGQLRRGVNILGYDGIWTGGIDAPFRMSDFKLIRGAGFDHVRVNFFGLRYFDGSDRLDEAVLLRLDKIIEAAVANDLTMVLDQHDNELCQETSEQCEARLVDFWRQVSGRYAGKQKRLVYEILNEPQGDRISKQGQEAGEVGFVPTGSLELAPE